MQQKILEFSVNDQFIHTPHYQVVADSKGYLVARFSFNETWQGLTKTAVFQGANGRCYHILLTEDSCLVPHEVITPTRFFVSVFGGDRLTTDRAVVDVAASGFSAGVTPPTPTRDLYDQMVEHFTLERSAAEAAAKTAEEKAEICVQSADTATLHSDTATQAAVLATAAAEQAVNADENVQLYYRYASELTEACTNHSLAAEEYKNQAENFAKQAEDAANRAENQLVSHTFDPESESPQSGKAVAQAMALVPTEKPMRLIAKGTLTEAVKTIVINKDMDGNDFEIGDQIDIYVDASKVEKSNSLFVGFNSGVATTGSYITFITGGLHTGNRLSMFHLWYNGGFWDAFGRLSADSGYYSSCVGIPNGRKVAKNPTTNQIAIGGGCDLPVGTTYEIYGRDV